MCLRDITLNEERFEVQGAPGRTLFVDSAAPARPLEWSSPDVSPPNSAVQMSRRATASEPDISAESTPTNSTKFRESLSKFSKIRQHSAKICEMFVTNQIKSAKFSEIFNENFETSFHENGRLGPLLPSRWDK